MSLWGLSAGLGWAVCRSGDWGTVTLTGLGSGVWGWRVIKRQQKTPSRNDWGSIAYGLGFRTGALFQQSLKPSGGLGLLGLVLGLSLVGGDDHRMYLLGLRQSSRKPHQNEHQKQSPLGRLSFLQLVGLVFGLLPSWVLGLGSQKLSEPNP